MERAYGCKNLLILLAKSVLPICSWDWQISEPAFYEAIAPSDGCTDGFASRVREFANSIGPFVIRGAAIVISTPQQQRLAVAPSTSPNRRPLPEMFAVGSGLERIPVGGLLVAKP